jgi:hypothetical protein
VLALWKFFAGDSRVAPAGIALAVMLGAVTVRLGWAAPVPALVFTGTLLATLALAARER